MGGLFSASGLISGIDSNTLIRQLIELDRQPIRRIERRIEGLETRRDAVRDLRTQLLDLRNQAQDFRLNLTFEQFGATSSDESVLTSAIGGSNPTLGSFEINVIQLASATVATSSGVLGSAINPAAALNASGMGTDVEAGTFSINGVSFNVDPATDTLNGILGAINGSAAGVTATYNAVTDTVTIENTAPNDTSIINFGAAADTGNFLDALSIADATQSTGAGGSTEVTSTRNLGSVNPGAVLNVVSFGGGAVTAGSFQVNGVSIAVDPTVDSLSDVITRINNSDAGVTASYDTASDTIRVISDSLGSRTVGFTSGTSNFLDVTNLSAATQSAGNDAQFSIDGGPVQTRNTNEVADAIGDVTLSFLSVGSSTVTASGDDDAIVEDMRAFVDAFNESLTQINELTGSGGDLRNDGSIRIIESFMRNTIFSQVAGATGDLTSLLSIGISTGNAFDSSAVSQLVFDEDEFREALRDDPDSVAFLLQNEAKTGIADLLFTYLDDVTSVTGILNDRAKSNGSIDQQITRFNDQIENIERRLEQRENRLRAQFTRLEQMTSMYQTQATFLANLSFGFQRF